MLETSQDILWVTLAVCIALFTLFSCWGIFYIVQIIRRAFLVVEHVEEMIKGITDTVKMTKERMERSAAYVSVIADGAKKVMEIVKENTGDGGKKKKKKK